jgi:hypothetical protein
MDDLTNNLSTVMTYISGKLSKNRDQAFTYEMVYIGNNEIDPLLREIRFCLILDLFQASITLTNNLLEKYLKLILIYNEHGKKQIKDASTINDLYGPATKKYNNKDLSDTINMACTKGFITKEEKKSLHEFRDRFRNAFGHSDMDKMFKDTKIPFVLGKLSDINKSEIGEARLSEVPFLQGIAQEGFAERYALEYFNFVDNMIKNKIELIK